jgi:threonine dehydratase
MTATVVPWPPQPEYELTSALIDEAEQTLAKYQLETPMLPSAGLSARLGRPVFFKCENQQRTGSFKVRGALARLSRLAGEDRYRGVVAASAGNHGLGVAWACRQLGIPGLVVLPEGTPKVKLAALEQMMIKVRLHGSGYDEAEARARQIAEEAQATFVSPFDDPWVMAGNGGTVGREIRRQLPDVSAVVAPLGGGGLCVGLAVALEGVPVVGVNSSASPAMARSLDERRVYLTFDSQRTIAEGLEGGVSASSAFLCARHVREVLVVDESSLGRAVALSLREERQVLEGSGAAAIAAVLERKPIPGAGPVCLVLTGRNIDRDRLRTLTQGSNRPT